MKQLPLGVYAVSEAFVEGKVNFVFQEESYEAEVGKNAFFNLDALVKAELVPAEDSFCGYRDLPVVLMVAGTCNLGKGETKEEKKRTRFPRPVAMLGENAGVSPNLADLRTAAPRREESVLVGSHYYGTIALEGEMDGEMILDGIELSTKVYDERTGGKNVALTVKNCIITSPLSYNLILVDGKFQGDRKTTVIDCRADGLESLQGEGNLVSVRTGDLVVERLYMANTKKFLGMSNYAYAVQNEIKRAHLRDSLFENCGSTHGFTVNLPEDAEAEICVERCEFLNFTPKEDAAITAFLSPKSSLTVKNTRFVGEDHTCPAVLIAREGGTVSFENTTVEGYTALCEAKKPRRETVNENAVFSLEDPHECIDEEDFAPLDALYEGKKLFFGDFHCHSNSGGTSDGRTPLAEYVPTMKELKMDFAAIVDHKQMRHYFLPEWDEKYLICGSEPGTSLNIPERPKKARGLHYTMIFPDKTGLAQVFGAFPEFEFTGTWQGRCRYPSFTLERFRELGAYIYGIGGLMSHAHPKQVMVSENPLDYYISDLVPLETVCGNPASFASRQNRDLWVSVLKLGKRVHTHGSSDAHGPVSNRGLTATYAKEHFSTDLFYAVRSGDCVAGGVGIQMGIDDVPMGGVATYGEGKRLRVRVTAFHPAHLQENTVYAMKIYTDRGLCFAKEFDGSAQSVILPVKERSYYRVEITNESENSLVALSNPIWLSSETAEEE